MAPVPPPRDAYHLFFQEQKSVAPTMTMAQIAEAWAALPEPQTAQYLRKVVALRELYHAAQSAHIAGIKPEATPFALGDCCWPVSVDRVAALQDNVGAARASGEWKNRVGKPIRGTHVPTLANDEPTCAARFGLGVCCTSLSNATKAAVEEHQIMLLRLAKVFAGVDNLAMVVIEHIGDIGGKWFGMIMILSFSLLRQPVQHGFIQCSCVDGRPRAGSIIERRGSKSVVWLDMNVAMCMAEAPGNWRIVRVVYEPIVGPDNAMQYIAKGFIDLHGALQLAGRDTTDPEVARVMRMAVGANDWDKRALSRAQQKKKQAATPQKSGGKGKNGLKVRVKVGGGACGDAGGAGDVGAAAAAPDPHWRVMVSPTAHHTTQ